MAGVADDDVVEDLDLQQLPGPDEVTRDLDVGWGRLGFARRVIVQQQDRARIDCNRSSKDLAWMHEDRVQDAC